jgi:hypothetical protein
MPTTSFLRALAHRNFRLFIVGQGVSLIGTWVQQVAIAWVVFRMTGSATLPGLVGFAGQIPGLVVAPGACKTPHPWPLSPEAGARGSRAVSARAPS